MAWRDPDFYVNLSAPDSASNRIDLQRSQTISISIDASTWGNAIVEMKWSLDDETWHAFRSPVTFDSTTSARRNLDVNSAAFVRLETTTADGSADSEAGVWYERNQRVFTLPFDFNLAGALRTNDLTVGLSIAREIEPGITVVSKYGFNPDIDISNDEMIWTTGGVYTGRLSTAQQLEIVSAAAGDNPSGLGARTVRIRTLGPNFERLEQTVTMNGTTPVTLTGTHMRVNAAEVVTSGAEGPNSGLITIRVAGAGATMTEIRQSEGRDLNIFYTVPADHTGYIKKWNGGLAGASAGAATGQLFLCHAPVEMGLFDTNRFILDAVVGIREDGLTFNQYEYAIPKRFREKTDIWVNGDSNANNTPVYAGYEVILVDNRIHPQ